jgi:hypothetical protein
MDEMIGGVALENMVMYQRVLFKGVAETFPRLVHEETVQRPFKERGKDHSRHESDREPKKERDHKRTDFSQTIQARTFLI